MSYTSGLVVVGSLGPRFSMDSEAVQAGVLWVTPVRQHPHLYDLEGLVILLLKIKSGKYSAHATDSELRFYL